MSRWALLIPAILYAAVVVVIMVACSGALWWTLGKAVVSGDFAKHPIASIVAVLTALPILAPMAVLAWLAALGGYKAIRKLLGHRRI
jgi:hypothetical protein